MGGRRHCNGHAGCRQGRYCTPAPTGLKLRRIERGVEALARHAVPAHKELGVAAAQAGSTTGGGASERREGCGAFLSVSTGHLV